MLRRQIVSCEVRSRPLHLIDGTEDAVSVAD
jgi:hypothetical protein